MYSILNSKKITEMAKALFAQKRAGNRLDGWFIAKEAELELSEKYKAENEEVKKALILRDIVKIIPINISEYHLFAGTQKMHDSHRQKKHIKYHCASQDCGI